MPTDAQEQADRRKTLENDRLVREQQRASTYAAFAAADEEFHHGRFHQMSGATHVVGSTQRPEYPQAAPPWQEDLVPNEEPLGHRVDEMQPLDPPPVGAAAGVTGDPMSSDPLPAGSPCPDVADVERDVGSPSSFQEW
jgi:hypothetical protein